MNPPSPSLLDSTLVQFLLVFVVPLLLAVLLAGLGWLAKQSAQWFGQRTKDSRLWGLVELTQKYAFDALLVTGGELHREYQRLVADGTLDQADRAKLRARGTEIVKQWLGAQKIKALADLTQMGGAALESWLGAQVDGALAKLASSKGALTVVSAGGAATPVLGTPAVLPPL